MGNATIATDRMAGGETIRSIISREIIEQSKQEARPRQKSIMDTFNEFMDERIGVGTIKVINDPEYKKASKEADELYSRIRELLGEENKGLILDYDTALGSAGCIENDYAYRQGVKDGLVFMETLAENLNGGPFKNPA